YFDSDSINQGINQDYVLSKSTVVNLTPILDKTVLDHFISADNFAKYLSVKNGEKEENYKSYAIEAAQLFKVQSKLKVREIIKTKEDLEALASHSVHSLDIQKPMHANAIEKELKTSKETLQKLEAEIEQIRQRLSSTENHNEYNALVDYHNKLIYQHKSMVERYNQAVNIYNSLGGVRQSSVIEIGGGIDLEPGNFKIMTPSSSAKLQEFSGIIDKVSADWRSLNRSGKWIRNGIGGAVTEAKSKLPEMAWVLKKEGTSGSSTYRHLQSGIQNQYWSSSDLQVRSWRD